MPYKLTNKNTIMTLTKKNMAICPTCKTLNTWSYDNEPLDHTAEIVGIDNEIYLFMRCENGHEFKVIGEINIDEHNLFLEVDEYEQMTDLVVSVMGNGVIGSNADWCGSTIWPLFGDGLYLVRWADDREFTLTYRYYDEATQEDKSTILITASSLVDTINLLIHLKGKDNPELQRFLEKNEPVAKEPTLFEKAANLKAEKERQERIKQEETKIKREEMDRQVKADVDKLNAELFPIKVSCDIWQESPVVHIIKFNGSPVFKVRDGRDYEIGNYTWSFGKFIESEEFISIVQQYIS